MNFNLNTVTESQRAAVRLARTFVYSNQSIAHSLFKSVKLTEHDVTSWIEFSEYKGVRPDLTLLNCFIIDYNKTSAFFQQLLNNSMQENKPDYTHVLRFLNHRRRATGAITMIKSITSTGKLVV